MTRTNYWAQAVIGGTVVDLLNQQAAVALIVDHADDGDGQAPLAVVSANLDHVHHFGTGGRWAGTIGSPSFADAQARSGRRTVWLNLLDGAPLVDRARALTGMRYPRLAGSDLIEPLLTEASHRDLTVGFVGGAPETQRDLRRVLRERLPKLRLVGTWAPEREELTDLHAMRRLTEEVRAAGVDLLVVGLGKPRQELWIAEHGEATGARVMLAFGAVVDFLANRVPRANPWVRDHGLEWAWRLSREPSRLAGRYLVQGPPALVSTRTTGAVMTYREYPGAPIPAPRALRSDRFAQPGERADVAVLTVTYNNVDDIDHLVKSLRGELDEVTMRLVVADNSSTDGTLDQAQLHADVVAFGTGGNLGYAGGINRAREVAGPADAYLVLNPDLTVEPGSVAAMLARLRVPSVGAVVPRLLDPDGTVYRSLRREPSVTRVLGDAIFGSRWSTRHPRLSEIDHDDDSYHHPHPVDWATGAALMVRADVADQIGRWDEQYFLYSEETDYCRRIRETGTQIWYEPAASITHQRGGSGSSPGLTALMEVNRVRYAETHGSPVTRRAVRGAVLLGAVVRGAEPAKRAAASALLSRRSWARLPHAQLDAQPGDHPIVDGFPEGSIIIPAHDEASLIARTLTPLARLAECGIVEILVVCNGCTDDTARIARRFAGVTVIELETASKVDALNAGDQTATRWPRLYLDADIRISLQAVRDILARLQAGDILAARPVAHYDVEGASVAVASYYRARMRAKSLHKSLWGAGAYAVSRRGHERFVAFPQLVADDLWFDGLFGPTEKAVIDTEPVTIGAPRTGRDLLATLRRVYRGNNELGSTELHDASPSTSQTALDLLRASDDARKLVDTTVYSAFALAGRLAAMRAGNARWERDASSRA